MMIDDNGPSSRQMSAQAKIREVDTLQQTLPMLNAQKIRQQLNKIDADIAELTGLIFPGDKDMACEMVREGYQCENQ